jgi:carbamoyl-phosphate synthase large subunit
LISILGLAFECRSEIIMENVLTVVVSGVGSTIGLGIAKALRMCSIYGIDKIRIVGVDANPLAVGLYCLDAAHLVPSGTDSFDAYFEALVEVCREEEADIFLSGWDGELIPLGNRAEEFFDLSGTQVGHRPFGVAEASDKWLTYEHLALRHKISMPKTVLTSDVEGMRILMENYPAPYILKPRCGSGSRGLFKVKTLDEALFLTSYLGEAVLQEELLPADEEYTIGVFMMDKGDSSGAFVLKRSLMSGLSYRMEVVENTELANFAIEAVRALGLEGVANVQLRQTSEGCKLFEINPRFSSSSSVRAVYGFNEAELAVRYFLLKERPKIQKTLKGICLRYWEEMFIPADAKVTAAEGSFARGSVYGLVPSKQDL